MSVNSLADRALTIRRTASVASRHGTAIAVRLRLPSRRSTLWLAATGSASLGGVATGAVVEATGTGNSGAWLLVASGVVGVAALIQAADLHRSRS